MKLFLKDIYYDKDIYPRETPSGTVIEEYEESLLAGKNPPAIIVKKILYVENGNEIVRNAIIDGVHRYNAINSYNKHSGKNEVEKIEDMEVKFLDDTVVRADDSISMANLIIESARYNALHGVRIKKSEMVSDARRIYSLNKTFVQQDLADIFGVTQRTVGNWIKDLVLAENSSENAVILKLNLLGWTQEEIGAVVGLTHQAIALRLQEIENFLKLAKSLSASGQSAEKIARDQQIDLQVVFAILNSTNGDAERMKALKCDPRPYDVWNFSDCNPLCGSEYPGRIPGQLVLQTLFFYTKQGDLVVDPMGGSGTTIDACLLMGRKCRAFDSKPEQKRVDIITKDAIAGLSEMKQKVDLIFIDPPYFKKVDAGYSDASISRFDKFEYMKFFETFAVVAKKSLKKGGKLAFLMSDFTEDNPENSIFLHNYIDIFTAAGFVVERVIQCPLSTQQVHPDIINKFRSSKKLARLSRNLVIFQ
jgi:hypothetical protein